MKAKDVLLYLIPIVCGLFVFSDLGYSRDFSESDAQTIEQGDLNSCSYALARLMDLRKAQGNEALRPAVPALVNRALKILRTPEKEGGEVLSEIIGILMYTGDERAKPVLLEVMSSNRIAASGFVAEGLLNIGRSVIPSIVDSLKSEKNWTRAESATILMIMAEKSPSFFTEAERIKIRNRLVANLTNENGLVRHGAISALRVFGDASVISVLEEIAKQDPDPHPSGRYWNRIEAAKTLEKLKAAR